MRTTIWLFIAVAMAGCDDPAQTSFAAAAEQDRGQHQEEAVTLYVSTAQQHPDTRHGKLAKVRAEVLLLELGAQGKERVRPVELGGLNQAVKLRSELVVIAEPAVCSRGDGEPGRNLETENVADLSEVGHLRSDDAAVGAADVA